MACPARKCLWRLLALGLLATAGAHLGARETWRKVVTSEFAVITPLEERAALAAATEFAQYVSAQRAFFGGRREALPALTIVIFAREKDFDSYRPLVSPGGKPLAVGGFFSRHESWAVVGMPARVSEDTRRTIFHEGVHWFLSASRTRNPIWVEEGLAEVFSTFRVDGAVAEWGRVIESHVQLLRKTPPMPLQQLLAVSQAGLGGDDRRRTGAVYAGAWAFVHFLMFGKHEIPRTAISDYLEAVTSGTPPAEAAPRVFGRPLADLDRALRRYLEDGDYFMARLPLTAADQPVVSPAGSAEVEHALGRLALAGRRVDLAMRHAGAMLLAVPNDPRAHELLALGLRARGDAAGALAAFETAVARGSGGFQPYYEVAAAAHRTASARGRTLEGSEARRIADLYQSALQRYPRHQASYENLAGLLGVVDPLREEDRRWMELGRRLFPESGMIQLGVAQGVRRAGDSVRARTMLVELLAIRPPPETVELANRLLDGWEFEEIGRQIDELGRGGRFRDALAALEGRLAEGVRPGVRERLLPVRAQLRGATLAEDAKRAWEAQDWREARRALTALVDSTAPEPMKEQARRMLAELDQKRPGLPAEAR
ncbi:MAG: DUF1570 domain-containing protein [Verrucomicrobia bacterium]|nr:DUF1570 domain-containing protein [Verrucomicrobiota bacterium]